MWLPHGLAANTQLSSIQPLIKICAFVSSFDEGSACKDVEFQLSRPSKGTLQAAVPALGPKQRYKVTVRGDAKVGVLQLSHQMLSCNHAICDECC
jgi:hypothetical protein